MGVKRIVKEENIVIIVQDETFSWSWMLCDFRCNFSIIIYLLLTSYFIILTLIEIGINIWQVVTLFVYKFIHLISRIKEKLIKIGIYENWLSKIFIEILY